MERVTHATKAADLFGAGKDGFTDGVPSVTEPTILDSDVMNMHQEELARAIEAFGVALDGGDMEQLATVLTTLLNEQGGSTSNQDDPEVPVFATNTDSHKQNGSNIWKLLIRAPLPPSSSRWVRVYVGDWSAATFAITVNARWEASDQTWNQDSTGESNLFRFTQGEWHLYGKASGASAWGNGSWDTSRGVVRIGDTLHVGNDINAGDDITAGDQLVAGGDIYVGNDAHITHNLRVGDDFLYSTPPTRNTPVALSSGYGINFKTFEAYLVVGSSDVVTWPILLPHGAVLQQIQFMLNKSGTASDSHFTIVKKSPNWGAPGTVSGSGVGDYQADAVALGGFQIVTIDCDDEVISGVKEYECTFSGSSDNDDQIHAIRVTWTDPGPRNF